MALSSGTRRALTLAMAEPLLAKEVADLVDTGASGTLSGPAAARLALVVADLYEGANLVTAINASTPMSAKTLQRLEIGLADPRAARDIQAGL